MLNARRGLVFNGFLLVSVGGDSTFSSGANCRVRRVFLASAVISFAIERSSDVGARGNVFVTGGGPISGPISEDEFGTLVGLEKEESGVVSESIFSCCGDTALVGAESLKNMTDDNVRGSCVVLAVSV